MQIKPTLEGKSNEYINLVGFCGGIFVRNLPEVIAVPVLTRLLANADLMTITMSSKTTVSRCKTGKAEWSMKDAKSIYEFYSLASEQAIDAELPYGNYIPLFTQADVRETIDKYRNMVEKINSIISQTKTETTNILRVVRDEAPTAVQKKEFEKKVFTEPEKKKKKEPQSKEKDGKSETEKIDKKSVGTVTNNNSNKQILTANNVEMKLVISTDNFKQCFFAPDYKEGSLADNMRVMGEACGYKTKEQALKWNTLDLETRFLLEFYSLISVTPLSQKDNEYRQKAIKGDKSAFWNLHSKYGADDNSKLREKTMGQHLSKKEPVIKEEKDWVNNLLDWLKTNSFNDKNFDHSKLAHEMN